MVPHLCSPPCSVKQQKLLTTSSISAVLDLKVGAQVQCLVNLPVLGVVNGTPGVIRTLGHGKPGVHVCVGSAAPLVVPTHERTSRFEAGGLTGLDAFIVLRQLPLKLAYASTIHSAQGMSVSTAIVSTQGAFAAGQTYTA